MAGPGPERHRDAEGSRHRWSRLRDPVNTAMLGRSLGCLSVEFRRAVQPGGSSGIGAPLTDADGAGQMWDPY
ncbi:hypothetical protein NDU88_001176 [Pleurodeles waltl]|uniref:Uncharacterized protein n=1 Tax=Pleurodeles waltl TaxID=8319 RepID=A0AAV7THL5_PLEWA|nr:hypothetical protein NDU88_001176 [Pleurodeles waltl]